MKHRCVTDASCSADLVRHQNQWHWRTSLAAGTVKLFSEWEVQSQYAVVQYCECSEQDFMTVIIKILLLITAPCLASARRFLAAF